MKRQPRLKALIFATVLSFSTINLQAQDIDFGDVLSAGLADANAYLEQYIAPGINSFSNGLAGGWNNTAKPHKLLGFDLTFSMNVATIPSSEETFNYAAAGFQQLQYTGTGPLPTIVGGGVEPDGTLFIPVGATLDYGGGNTITLNEQIDFPVAEGFNLDDSPITGVPVPTLNFGLGLVKNTDLKIRLIPAIDLGDFSVNMFGIGVLHDIKQWIPGMKLLPFDLSGFIGYTKLDAEFGLPDISTVSTSGSTVTTFSGSGVSNFEASATTIQVIASKKLAILTPYIGLGINAVNTKFNVKGDFNYRVDVGGIVDQEIDFSDPLDLEFSGAGGPRLQVGARLKLLILTIHADYTIQKYNQLTVGLGLSVR